MDPKSISTTTERADSRTKHPRLLRLAAIGIVVVLAGATYRYFWLAKPMGNGPAGPSVPREAFSRPWTERSVVLLGIGDSVTAGLGASRSDLSYFNRLVRNPPDEFADMEGICLSVVLPILGAQNIAVSGSNSLQHLDRLESLEPFPESVLGIVVMTSGGNDLIHWYGRTPPREGAMYGATLEQAQPWIRRFEERLNRMVDLLAEKFPGGCEVFLGDIYDPSDGVGDAPSVFLPAWPDAVAIHAAYNRVIHRCAEQREHVHLVPMIRTTGTTTIWRTRTTAAMMRCGGCFCSRWRRYWVRSEK